jgi:hypothetical protein
MVQHKLATDPDLEALAKYYQKLYSELNPLLLEGLPGLSDDSNKGQTPVVDEPVSELYLSAWKEDPQISRPLVLAASSVSEGIQNVQTLFSEIGKMVVRVLANFRERRFELYMISETLGEGVPALLTVPDHNRQYLLSNGEMVAVSFEEEEEDPTKKLWPEGVLRIPFKVTTMDASKLMTDGQFDGIRWSVDASLDEVQFFVDGSNGATKLIPGSDRSPRVSFFVFRFDAGTPEIVKALPQIKLPLSGLKGHTTVDLNFFV